MMWRSDYPESGSLLTLFEMVSRVCTLYCLDGYFLGNIFYVVDPYLTAPVAIALDAVDPQSRKLFCRKPFDLVKTEDYFWTIDRATDSIVETKRWLTSPPEPEGLESYSLEAGIMLGWTQEGYAGKRRRAEELLRGMPGIELTVADVVLPQVLVIRFGERRYHVTQLEIDLEGEETKLTAEQIA